MDCRNLTKNRSSCACTYEPCPRKGICCECLAYHAASRELPGCLFSKKGERSYDRSLENFIKDQKGT